MAIRIGVVGLGWSGLEMHCAALRELREFELVGGIDPDPKTTRRAEEEFGMRTYQSFESFLEKEKADCVAACVPNYLHLEVARQALEAGIGVVIEKPLALNAREADELIATAERHGRMLTVFNTRRWYPNFIAVRQVLERKEIGDALLMESRIARFDSQCGATDQSWRNWGTLGGGALYHWGAHLFDQVLLLARELPTSVYCIIKDDFYATEADDYFKAILRFDSGLIAQVEMSSLADLSLPAWYVVGTRGSILSEMDNIWGRTVVSVGTRGDVKRYFASRPDDRNYLDVAKLFYRKVAKTLNEGGPVPVSPGESRQVVRLIEYCLESHEKQAIISCEEFAANPAGRRRLAF